MKKVYKISGSLLAALLYFMVALLLTQSATLQNSSVLNTQTGENHVWFTAEPADFFSVPLNQKLTFNQFNGAKYSGSEFQDKSFSACLKQIEKSISTEFVQYIFQAENFPIRLRKADLLFPFHYFW